MTQKNYWVFRVDKRHSPFLYKELQQGRLRQGWGYHDGQNLKHFTFDGGARRNFPMLKVRKGDIVIIPHIKEFNHITLVTATEDWNTAYRFEIDPTLHDFGHIFPAKIECSIPKHHKEVLAALRRTLTNRSRFWNINWCAEEVEHILSLSKQEIAKFTPREDMATLTENLFEKFFQRDAFLDLLYKQCTRNIQDSEWEGFIVQALRALFPFYQVEKVGGKSEEKHGTDIKITLPGLFEDSYVIAIQVKDYKGLVPERVIEQINKSDFFNKTENNKSTKVIEKIVLVTQASKSENTALLENKSGVKFIFAEDFKDLLMAAAEAVLGLSSKE